MSLDQNPNARSWFFNMQDLLSHDDFIGLGVALWAIWSARRKVIHEETFQPPIATHDFVNSFVADLQVIMHYQGLFL